MLIMAILKKSRNLGDCRASLSDSVICCRQKLVSNSNKSSNKTFKQTNRYKMLEIFESHSSPFLFCQILPTAEHPGHDYSTVSLLCSTTLSCIRQKRRESDPRPAWMRTLHTTATNWLSMIPRVRNSWTVSSCTSRSLMCLRSHHFFSTKGLFDESFYRFSNF